MEEQTFSLFQTGTRIIVQPRSLDKKHLKLTRLVFMGTKINFEIRTAMDTNCFGVTVLSVQQWASQILSVFNFKKFAYLCLY